MSFSLFPTDRVGLSNFYLHLRNLYVTRGNGAFRRALREDSNGNYRVLKALYPECRAMHPRKVTMRHEPVMFTDHEVAKGMMIDAAGNRVVG